MIRKSPVQNLVEPCTDRCTEFLGRGECRPRPIRSKLGQGQVPCFYNPCWTHVSSSCPHSDEPSRVPRGEQFLRQSEAVGEALPPWYEHDVLALSASRAKADT